MTKVVSILSAGHSGSTLCDILMGTISGVFSSGECVHFPWQIHRNGEVCKKGHDICSCGNKFSECETWVKVVRELSQITGYDIFADPFRFKMAMYKSQIYNESPRINEKFLRSLFIRILQYTPTVANNYFINHVRRQLENNWLFFDTIGHLNSISHVVDSSKDIVRMRLLHQERPEDVYTVVLLRDIRGVVASAFKRGKKPLEEANKWLKHYRQYLNVLKKTEGLRLKLIHYEDLAARPEQVRNELAIFLELEPPQTPLVIDTREHHLIAGNPMRYNGKITIRYDDSWKKVLTSDVKNKIYAMKDYYEPLIESLTALSE